jgi:hypothetical protein
MKRGLLRLYTKLGELRLYGSPLMTQVIALIFPPTLPPGDRALIVEANGQMKYGAVGGAVPSYQATFTAESLTDDVIIITHGLNLALPQVTVFNSAGRVSHRAKIRALSANQIELDFTPYSDSEEIEGTYAVRVS